MSKKPVLSEAEGVESGAKSGEPGDGQSHRLGTRRGRVPVEGKVSAKVGASRSNDEQQVSRIKRDQLKRTETVRSSQPGSSQEKAAQTDPVETRLAELEQQLGEHISSEVERQFQSAKDRRWAQLERQFGALSEFQKSLSQSADGSAQPTEPRQGDWLTAKTRGLLEAAGLANDPEVKAMIAEGGYEADVDGYVELLGDITEIVLKRAGRPRATAASVVQPSGDGAPAPDLQSEYEVRKRRIRPGDVNALMELKREFRQKGLEVF